MYNDIIVSINTVCMSDNHLCRMGVFLKLFSLLQYYYWILKTPNNYTAISLCSVFGNLLDKIIIEKQFGQLSTSAFRRVSRNT